MGRAGEGKLRTKERAVIEKIEPWIKGKRVLILGFGREGQSTWRVLRKLGTYETLDIADMLSPKQLPDKDILWITGPDYQKCLDNYDVVFKSPGIVLERPLEEYHCRIVSQTEVFFHCFREQIVGITGTKGKSTTTSLLYHLLKNAGMDTMIAGNIGIPAFECMEEIHPDTKIIFELSCHQLEYMTVSPHIGILINIHEEHLDHYGTMEKYVAAKEKIFFNQKQGDILFCNVQCLPKPGSCVSRIVTVCGDGSGSADIELSEEEGQAFVLAGGQRYRIPSDEIRLLGTHNYFNIGIAYGVCRYLGMSESLFTEGLMSYEPLPHRLQFLGEREGVRYYDDSISTICDTTIQALKTLPDTDSILIGGMDRGIDYRELIQFLSQWDVPHIILMEATGKRIFHEIEQDYPQFKEKQRLVLTEHLEDAVREAKRLTRPGHCCVLSPAAASYGIFKNFEERGRAFAGLVMGNGGN
jgi:UDP-N-acetylmuramoylalanine--D-glutamate ligase